MYVLKIKRPFIVFLSYFGADLSDFNCFMLGEPGVYGKDLLKLNCVLGFATFI